MRLINADALKDRLLKIRFVASRKNGTPMNLIHALTIAICCIDDTKTIDAKPVERGEWVTSEKPGHMATIKCSQCGTMYQRRFKAQYNFCPECGADMRGDKDAAD